MGETIDWSKFFPDVGRVSLREIASEADFAEGYSPVLSWRAHRVTVAGLLGRVEFTMTGDERAVYRELCTLAGVDPNV